MTDPSTPVGPLATEATGPAADPGSPDDGSAAPAVERPSRWRRLGDDLRVVGPAWLVARILFALGWWVAVAVADRWYAVRTPALQDGLLAWDGSWYRDIATKGYESLPLESLRFFPGYPWLGKLVSPLTGFSVSPALVLVANLGAVVVAVLVRRLVQAETDDRAAADRAVWVVMLFPSAFTLVLAYAESLFLVGAVGALFAARRGRWGWALAAGLLASVTRPLGILLVVPLAIEAVRAWRGSDEDRRLWSVLAVGAPVAGTALYLGWVDRAWGKWTLPLTVQNDLRSMDVDPLTRILRGVGDLVGGDRFGGALHVPFAIAFVVLLVLTGRRWASSYTAYAALVLVAALSAANLNSIERYALNAFPLLLTLALLLRTPRLERWGLAVCGCGFVALTSLAFLGVYVP